MTEHDPAPAEPVPWCEKTAGTSGASCRVGRSYGPPYEGTPAQEGGERPDDRHQGAPVAEGQAEQQSPSAPPFPDRVPRRRARNPSQRTHKLTTRLSQAEKTEITAAAALRAVTVARFLASAALAAARGSLDIQTHERRDATVDELAALRTAVSRIGNNLNQIAYVYNSAGQPRPGTLDTALLALHRALTRIDDAADTLVRRQNR